MVLRGDLAHRIARVLRLPVGATVDVFDGTGISRPARIAEIGGDAVMVAFAAPVQRHPPEPVTLLCAALIRPARFEWLIEKATELGATAIQPLICARGVVRPAEVGAARQTRWRRIAVEAAEQCGRVTLPDLWEPRAFLSALAGGESQRFIAAEPAHGPAPPLGTLLAGIGAEPVSLLIGPEGGFTPDELNAAIDAGVRPVSLGPYTLRAETAAIAALAVLADARAGDGR
jgi:16S rRNA (uracil1498-N3)-methyltransferase